MRSLIGINRSAEIIRRKVPLFLVVPADHLPNGSTVANLSLDGLPCLSISVLRSETWGRAAFRNTGIQAAASQCFTWTLFLDDDLVPEPSWLKVFLDCAGKMPNVALVGGGLQRGRSGSSKTRVVDPKDSFAPGAIFGGNFALNLSVTAGFTAHPCFFDARFDEPGGGDLAVGNKILAASGIVFHHPDWLVSEMVHPAKHFFGRILRAVRDSQIFWLINAQSKDSWALFLFTAQRRTSCLNLGRLKSLRTAGRYYLKIFLALLTAPFWLSGWRYGYYSGRWIWKVGYLFRLPHPRDFAGS